MGLLKILGLGKDKTVEQEKQPIKATDDSKKDSHENGGCCGGCGSK